MRYLVDSDVSIDHLSGDNRTNQLIRTLLDYGIGISLITYGELYEGIVWSVRRAQAEAAFNDFLMILDVVPLHIETMRTFSYLRGDLNKRGLPLGDFDLLITATALQHDLTLVTRNQKHFGRIENLKLYDFES